MMLNGTDILIVEDSPTQALQLEALLVQNGCSVRVAENGVQALQLVAEHKPQVIISDIVMPQMDGYTLCKRLKSAPTTDQIPVILVTTLTDARDVVHGLACGADNFITKPYDEKYLLGRIRYFLNNMELRSQERMRVGIEIELEGERHFITAARQQILDLLISTYEEGIRLNKELRAKHEELTQAHTLINSLFHFTAGVSGAQSESEVINMALAQVQAFPGIQAAWLLLQSAGESGPQWRVAGFRGARLGTEEVALCAQSCACIDALSQDALKDVTSISECPTLMGRMPDSHHASIPLTHGKDIFGLLNVVHGDGAPWAEAPLLQTLRSVGHQLTVALSRARLFDSLESLVSERTRALQSEMAEREQIQVALRHSEALLRKILETLPVAVCMADSQGQIILHNPEFERLWAGALHVGVNRYHEYQSWWPENGENIAAHEWPLARAALQGESIFNAIMDLQAFDGTRRTVMNSAVPLRDAQGRGMGAISVMQDVTAQRQAETELRLRNRAIEASVNAITITDCQKPDDPVVYVNQAFERITGYKREEVLGRNCRFLHRQDSDQPGLEYIRRAMRNKSEGSALMRNYRKDGSLFWNELHVAPVTDAQGRVTHFVGVLNDVTDAKLYEEQLEYQTNFDTLTGLPNRNLLHDRIQQAITHAASEQAEFAVAYIDLDHFKNVNDSLGHDIGDLLLKEVANTLRDSVRNIDTVARVGGDEFVVVLTGTRQLEFISHQLNRILTQVGRSYRINGADIFMTCSIGFCLYPDNGTDLSALLKNADMAMNKAKETGRNRICGYTQKMNEKLLQRLTMEHDLRYGIDRGELQLCFQPQLNTRDQRVGGLEALVRWHRGGAIIPPAEFIPLAENTGLIQQVDQWVLRQACEQVKLLHDSGIPPVSIAVNLSALQFQDDRCVTLVDSVLKDTGINPCHLKLEVTESMVMQNADEALDIMSKLKNLGVQLSLDDFGTGYSSLSYLKRFPFDQLKIDKSFIDSVINNREGAAVVQAILTLGHALNIKVVAEGVETEEQCMFLEQAGCDLIQGYYFSRPLPIEECSRFLQSKSRARQRREQFLAP